MSTLLPSNWETCPKCGTANLSYGDIELDSDHWQDVECLGCGFKWREIYEHTRNESFDGEVLDSQGNVIKDENIILSPAKENAPKETVTSGSPVSHVCPKCGSDDWWIDASNKDYLICNACNYNYPAESKITFYVKGNL